jgi:hypothetical protein
MIRILMPQVASASPCFGAGPDFGPPDYLLSSASTSAALREHTQLYPLEDPEIYRRCSHISCS